MKILRKVFYVFSALSLYILNCILFSLWLQSDKTIEGVKLVVIAFYFKILFLIVLLCTVNIIRLVLYKDE
jgi:hypothetical protein